MLTTSPVLNDYEVLAEIQTLDEKKKILEELGHLELIKVFKEYKPKAPKKETVVKAPLDQSVSITVTDAERSSLMQDLAAAKKASKENISISYFVRSRVIGSVDINEWAQRARKALKEITEISSNKKELEKDLLYYKSQLEEDDDDEQLGITENKISEINFKLKKIVAQNKNRTVRLTGRMSTPEAETVKWRSSRLSISASDYMRMLIFNLLPDSDADAHMSLKAKQRFYISIIDIANNGWGKQPSIVNCSQCANYLDEIRKLKDQIKQLKEFG